jgi:hypothetical protein
MSAAPDEIKRRELVARAAIKCAFECDEDEVSARLFVSHHLAELDSSYWKRHLSTESPAPSAVLDLLQLRSHWGGKDEMETFDFTLPGDVTNYVICVRFDGEGEVSDIEMES